MTSILRGIVYLISLRWALGHNSADGATGPEVVNEVLSLERPFSFSEVVEPTVSEVIEPTATVSTQTDDMDYGLIYELIIPYVVAYGAVRVLWRLRSTLPVIGDSMSWRATSTDSEMTPEHSPDPDSSTPHRLEERSPDSAGNDPA